MNYVETREIVRVRHELRRLRAEGRGGDARALLARLRELAELDPSEAADVQPEIERWECSLGLGQ